MSVTNKIGFDWTKEEFENFSLELQLLDHNYQKSPLFSDEALIELLDNYPRKWLQCYTMGTNPEDHSDWTTVHIADRTGEEILQALKKGRIWINAVNFDQYKTEYSELIEQMYQKIDQNCSAITNVKPSFSALLVSSPGIQVYYHLDPDPNMLWHLKGTKKVWVYPPHDERFTPQHYIEEIIGEERHENLPYKKSFDEYAQSYELKPGQLVSWPQHSPHRVENVDLNVSLTSSYGSKQSRRLNGVHGANHYILKRLGIKNRSVNTKGLIPAIKAFSYYGLNRLNILKKGSRTSTYVSDLMVDPNSDTGLSKMEHARRTAFSYTD